MRISWQSSRTPRFCDQGPNYGKFRVSLQATLYLEPEEVSGYLQNGLDIRIAAPVHENGPEIQEKSLDTPS